MDHTGFHSRVGTKSIGRKVENECYLNGGRKKILNMAHGSYRISLKSRYKKYWQKSAALSQKSVLSAKTFENGHILYNHIH